MKHTQLKSKDQLKRLLSVTRGDTPADLLIKNVWWMDLIYDGQRSLKNILISDGYITNVEDSPGTLTAKNVLDASRLTIIPGFIDAHVHIESSLVTPFEFQKMTLPRGTTTAICDPHEIVNVYGKQGFEWFLDAAVKLEQNLFVQVSSCVPSLPGHETNGGNFTLEQMRQYKDHPHVLGLAEMMNFPAVIAGSDEAIDKIWEFSLMNLDGHCPLVRGKKLDAYILSGVQNCHETVNLEEGKEKLLKGMGIILREGSVAKNLNTLAPLLNPLSSSQCMLCTDDRNPLEIQQEGHLNYMIKNLIEKHAVPAHVAFRAASFSAAKHFGLKRLGLIAPGMKADFILLKGDPAAVNIHQVFIGGQDVSSINFETKQQICLGPSIKRQKLNKDQCQFNLSENKTYRVIQIVQNEIITKEVFTKYLGNDRFDQPDIAKIMVAERYGHNRPLSQALVQGFKMSHGAIASSVAHDSHNLIVVSKSAASAQLALNTLIDSQGGFVVVDQEKVLAHLPLPIGGLMTELSAEEVEKKLLELQNAYQQLGGKLSSPFLQLAFLSLPVIPHLKITDHGLFDAQKFQFVPVQID